ncbi:hypothetical protein JTB14_014508 [Gonioctena quinquepunctata]|nr:hypothetical protein JTB14_014508 [Gonioctena quinquepunctata]
MILLGQDNIHLTVARKVIQSTKNEPIATKTNLGWILHGGNSIEQEKQAYSFHICSSEISDISLHEMVKQSSTTDAFGVVSKKTNINKAEARAIDIMKSSDADSSPNFSKAFLRRLCWKKNKKPVESSEKCVAIGNAITSDIRPRTFLSPILTGISLLFHRKYASKNLIDLLASLGFTSAYYEGKKLELSAIAHAQLTYKPAAFNQLVIDKV